MKIISPLLIPLSQTNWKTWISPFMSLAAYEMRELQQMKFFTTMAIWLSGGI